MGPGDWKFPGISRPFLTSLPYRTCLQKQFQLSFCSCYAQARSSPTPPPVSIPVDRKTHEFRAGGVFTWFDSVPEPLSPLALSSTYPHYYWRSTTLYPWSSLSLCSCDNTMTKNNSLSPLTGHSRLWREARADPLSGNVEEGTEAKAKT